MRSPLLPRQLSLLSLTALCLGCCPHLLFAVQRAESLGPSLLAAGRGWKAPASGGSDWIAPVMSLLVPGTGQIRQGHPRALGYIALEAWLIGRYLTSVGDGHEARDRYIDLAFSVARAPFNPVIRDTVFEYFETVGKFVESGPFDADSGVAFAPPADPASYNGAQWRLAAERFSVDPDAPDVGSPGYAEAVAYYRSRAVGPNFRWSWAGEDEALSHYRVAVQESDEAFRRGSQTLGLLLANHLLSALDAFVSERFARRGVPVEVETTLLPTRLGTRDVELGVRARIAF
jgi:hypothetical protein